MPSFVRCVSVLGFDMCVVCQVAGGHNELIPMIRRHVAHGLHSACFTHECSMDTCDTSVVSRCIWHCKLMLRPSQEEPLLEFSIFQLAIVGAIDANI